MEYVKIDKKLSEDESKKGLGLVNELNVKFQQFKFLCLAYEELIVEKEKLFGEIKKIAGKRFPAFISGIQLEFKKKEKELCDNKLIVFHNICLRETMMKNDRREIWDRISALKKMRDKFSQKMFRVHKLDIKKTYRFNFETKEILVQIPDKSN
jgi:hypothetical protein